MSPSRTIDYDKYSSCVALINAARMIEGTSPGEVDSAKQYIESARNRWIEAGSIFFARQV